MTFPMRLGMTAGLAVPMGALAILSPHLALGALLGLGFAALAAYDIAAGVAAFTILALLEQIPPVANTPAIKLAGAVLIILMLRKDAPLLSLAREHPAVASLALFFVAWAVISSLWAEDSHVALSSASRLALCVAFVFVVYGAIRERRQARLLIYTFIAGAVLTLVIGLVGLKPVSPDPGSVASNRFVGAVGQANELASILVVAFGLAVFALAASRTRQSRILISVSLVAILIALLATGSRGGLVSLAAALATAIIAGGTLRKHFLVAVAAAVAIGVGYYTLIAPAEVKDRVTQVGSGSGRTDLWTVASLVVKHRPFFGVGSGNFIVVEASYAAAPVDLPEVHFIVDEPLVPHNMFLSVQTELGIPGLLVFVTLLGTAIASVINAIKSARAAGDREFDLLGRGVLVALVGFLASAMFGSFEYNKQLWLLLGLTLAMATAVSASARLRSESTSANADTTLSKLDPAVL
jgi:O-antigen ligase